MKKIVFFFLFVVSGLQAFELKDRLQKAKTGDYIVAEANKMVTLLAIRSLTPTTLVLEEITAPLQNLKNRPTSWPAWIKEKAPGHTSWTMTEIDLATGQVLECYSFSKSAWLQLSQKESLFARLLNLPLQKTAPSEQKKIGPPPLQGESDFRKIWSPPLVFEGKKLEHASFEVFETLWPDDGTDLARQKVSLYFDRENRSPFPFWIQVDTTHLTATVRTIDAGKNLPIVYRSFPRRVPEFVGQPQKTENGLKLSLKSPKYYRQFELFAIDITAKEKQIFPILHSLIRNDEELFTLEIDEDELKQSLQEGHRYTWLLVPVGHHESYAESIKPFVWTQ
jgi:hypothetical protein